MENTNNVRITLENDDREQFYCVLEKAEDYSAQFEQVFSLRKGYGFSIRCHETRVDVYDYFSGETRASFRVLKTEDTSEPVFFYLKSTKK